MRPATIFNNVYKTLDSINTLNYIKHVYKGIRTDVPETTVPFIMLEPTADGELEKDINQRKRVLFGIDIISYTSNLSDPDKLIVGDVNYKGILDIENDIRAVLEASNTLGETVIDIIIEPVIFNLAQFPARGFTMPIRVLYDQLDGQ